MKFINGLGLAKKKVNSNIFQKISRAPIIHRTNQEPYGTGSVYVMHENHVWKMWYTNIVKWNNPKSQKPIHYNIRYAESNDGLHWERKNKICINYKKQNCEYVVGKPYVIKYKNLYLMTYSYRGIYYKIGFAVSRDGVKWSRHDKELGLDKSKTGWDSKMVCYGFPYIFANNLNLLYSGNKFGLSGIGLATLELKELDKILKKLNYI